MDVFLGLVMLAAPVTLGALVGLAAGRVGRVTWRRTLGAVAVVAPLEAGVLFASLGDAPWDALLAGSLGALGAAVGVAARRVPTARTAALIALTVALSGLALEVLVRALLEEPLAPAPPRFDPLVDQGRYALFPGTGASPVEGDLAAAGAHPVVLHVGDSMVDPALFPREQTLVGRLARLDPARAHVNLGVPGAAPDLEWLVTRRWLARTREVTGRPPALVVLYPFLMNDIGELGKRFAICGAAPLARLVGSAPVEGCPEPSEQTLSTKLLVSPPPSAVVRLATGSAVARHVLAALDGARWRAMADDGAFGRTEAERWASAERFYEALWRDLRDAGVPLVMVNMPYLPDLVNGLVADSPIGRHGARLAALARRLGVPLLDAAPPLRAAVEASGLRAVFPFDRGAAPDFHPGPVGHWALARWLVGVLPR